MASRESLTDGAIGRLAPLCALSFESLSDMSRVLAHGVPALDLRPVKLTKFAPYKYAVVKRLALHPAITARQTSPKRPGRVG